LPHLPTYLWKCFCFTLPEPQILFLSALDLEFGWHWGFIELTLGNLVRATINIQWPSGIQGSCHMHLKILFKKIYFKTCNLIIPQIVLLCNNVWPASPMNIWRFKHMMYLSFILCDRSGQWLLLVSQVEYIFLYCCCYMVYWNIICIVMRSCSLNIVAIVETNVLSQGKLVDGA